MTLPSASSAPTTLKAALEVIAAQAETIAAQAATIAAQAAMICALEERLAKLEARLKLDSSNSSKPPSSDSPFKRPPPKSPTGRKPGGQAGHPGRHRRTLAPTHIEPVLASQCAHCGMALPPESIIGLSSSHQVTDVEVHPKVTQFDMKKHRCAGCRRVTHAERPLGTAGSFGTDLEAIIATLTVRFHMSRLDVVELCRTVFGVTISVGSVQATCERMSDSVASTVQGIADHFATAAVAHADETGWYLRGKLVWMWAALTEQAEYFRVDPHRNTDAMKKLLGDFAGLLHSDRWKPYEAFSATHRQLCHAHLRRDIQALIDAGGESQVLGEKLLALSNIMFSDWHAFCAREIHYDEFAKRMSPTMNAWRVLAETAANTTTGKPRALGRSMLRLWPALWNFVDLEGVVPTNNEQERAIRLPVRIRKNSYGSTSMTGALFVTRMLSIVGTARRQGVAVLGWLKRARHAFRHLLDPPALLPI
ncbi:MAG: IS66 family transposase [Myxococcales bacterium]|nr:IS66 family transposase [Myxococcales bacterium]